MAGLVIYFENNDIDIFSGREIDLSAWNYNCMIGNIKDIIIINKTNQTIPNFNSDLNIQVVDTFPTLEGHITQLVCPWETPKEQQTILWDFNHNTDWYLFGAATEVNALIGDTLLTIPQHTKGALHSVHVASTVMYHRFYKLHL